MGYYATPHFLLCCQKGKEMRKQKEGGKKKKEKDEKIKREERKERKRDKTSFRWRILSFSPNRCFEVLEAVAEASIFKSNLDLRMYFFFFFPYSNYKVPKSTVFKKDIRHRIELMLTICLTAHNCGRDSDCVWTLLSSR